MVRVARGAAMASAANEDQCGQRPVCVRDPLHMHMHHGSPLALPPSAAGVGPPAVINCPGSCRSRAASMPPRPAARRRRRALSAILAPAASQMAAQMSARPQEYQAGSCASAKPTSALANAASSAKRPTHQWYRFHAHLARAPRKTLSP
jgi:hypothetical protein